MCLPPEEVASFSEKVSESGRTQANRIPTGILCRERDTRLVLLLLPEHIHTYKTGMKQLDRERKREAGKQNVTYAGKQTDKPALYIAREIVSCGGENITGHLSPRWAIKAGKSKVGV